MYNLIINFMKRIFIVVLLIITALSGISKLNAQSKNVVLLEGMISEFDSREPVATELFFIDETAKKIKVKSEINGRFQAVLTSGKTYIVTAKDYFISDEDAFYKTPTSTEYTEVKRNFKVSKVYKGMELISCNAFSTNNTTVSSEALEQILRLQGILEQNLKIKVEIIISSADTYFKDVKKKITEPNPKNPKKKVSKTVNETAEMQMEKLVSARKSNLRDILTVMKIREGRYFFTDKLENGKVKAKKVKKNKKDKTPAETEDKVVTLKIIVDEIMKL